MAKELMEIGGFITEGAEIVNHDNTLSGNGTVDSPLGVNETVLWEGSGEGSSITMSEAPSNFEIVKVLQGRNVDTRNYAEFPGNQTQWNMVSWLIAADGTNFICDAHLWSINGNTATKASDQRVTMGSTYSKSSNSFTKYIYKIVGINRKA
jgi:hypothetical protein